MLRIIAPLLTAVAASLLLSGCSDASLGTKHVDVPSPATWQLVYRNNTEGEALAGSKQDLFDAIRRGSPIRVAWGFKSERADVTISTEHVAEPVFLTIIGDSEVVVQIPEHIAQQSYVNPSKASFDTPAIMWRGLMSTNGKFDAVWVNRANGEEVRRLAQKVSLTWFAFQPSNPEELAQPIVLASPDGIHSASSPQAQAAPEEANAPETETEPAPEE